jgi:hypothetical protein
MCVVHPSLPIDYQKLREEPNISSPSHTTLWKIPRVEVGVFLGYVPIDYQSL